MVDVTDYITFHEIRINSVARYAIVPRNLVTQLISCEFSSRKRKLSNKTNVWRSDESRTEC